MQVDGILASCHQSCWVQCKTPNKHRKTRKPCKKCGVVCPFVYPKLGIPFPCYGWIAPVYSIQSHDGHSKFDCDHQSLQLFVTHETEEFQVRAAWIIFVFYPDLMYSNTLYSLSHNWHTHFTFTVVQNHYCWMWLKVTQDFRQDCHQNRKQVE